MRSKAASWVAFVVLVAVVVTLVLRHSVVATHVVGLIVQGLAVVLMIWARLHLRARSFHPGAAPTEGGLITSGPYHWVRHPIYAAIFYFLVAGVMFHLSLINAGLAVLAILAIAVRALSEEKLLAGMYPEYTDYAARTKRIIPFVL